MTTPPPGRGAGVGLPAGYVLSPGRPVEADAFRKLERLAGGRYRAVPGYEWVAADEPAPAGQLASEAAIGHILAARDAGGALAGWALFRPLDGHVHLAQLDVHPDHAGRRLGAALIDAVQAWGVDRGLPVVTLTTFRHVPFNAPYYARLGFHELPEADWGPGLRAVWDRHARSGLDMADRVAMARPLP